MSEVLFDQAVVVPLSALKPYDKNPRRGNVAAIADSLRENKQYRPIVVQKSTKKILAGNHTYMAAKELGWADISVVMVDVTADEAARIVLADNRTNDLASYDNEILAELLEGLEGSTAGTGYSAADVETLISTMDTAMEGVAATSDAVRENTLMESDELVDLPAAIHAREEPADPSDIESKSGELAGVLDLKEDMIWPGHGFWEIPLLREDMLITELPEPLTTWAGSATREMQWDGYWLYNWGVDSTSGMDDLSKIMLSFYTWDEYFECWWDNATRYLGKAVNSKIKYAITPNYSQGGMPLTLSLYALYRSRWVGRYLQEVGVKVMPDLEMREEPEFKRMALDSLPRPLPWAACQVQNLASATRGGKGEDAALRRAWVADMRSVLQEAQVENLLVYCTTSRWPEVRKWLQGLDVNLEFLPTRIELLSARAKANKRNPHLL